MTHRQALSESYRILSPFADPQRWEFTNNLFHLSFLDQHILKNARILDMGCGIGILALALKLLGHQVTGMDKYVFEPSTSYSVEDIARLRDIWQAHSLNISAGDALNGAPAITYDAVVSIAVIEHQKNLPEFMAGLMSYLKPGGTVYIATPNVTNFLNRWRFFFGRAPLGNIREFYAAGDRFTGHWREYTVAELRTIARLADLKVLEARNCQTLKPYLTKNWRKWHRLLARFLGSVFPGCGDTNYLWAQK